MKRLLIIEDEDSIRGNYCELFEEEGYNVSGASNGKEGIELAASTSPDLIICDIGMPGMDGFEVKEILSKDKTTSSIPFIYLTARTDTKDFQRGMELGADDYIIKPVGAVKLLELVANRLQKIDDSTRQSEARLNRAELISKSGSWEFHSESKKVIFSEGAKKVYGLGNDSVDYEVIKKFAFPECRIQIDNGFKLLIENDQPFNIEYKIKTADTGEIKFIHSVAEYNKLKKVLTGVFQDITDRKTAEQALNQSETRNRQIVENNPLPVVVVSFESGRFLYINQNGFNLFRFTSTDDYHNYNSLDYYADPNRHREIVDVLKKDGHISNMEIELKDITGRHFMALVSSVINIFENRLAAFITFHDITERKQNEELLKKYSKELEESYAAKDKLFTIIAHDLRGPFSPVLGLSQTIVNEFDSLTKDELRLYTTEIFNSMKSAHTLLENLLNWSKMETGVMKLNLSKINLFHHTENVMKLTIGNAKLKNILLVNAIDMNVYVSADSNMLYSVLQNLISNSIKFTNEQGVIKISSEMMENNLIQITVSDNGVGMTNEQTKSLFGLAAKSTRGTKDEKGTGLGLMICKEMIERQGGSISVRSEAGKGTHMFFTLLKIG
jgi:PAS domain S-box-containing protein